ncbi:MAG: amidohydrolase [Gemmatales bacterium]|nr:amidohydrolase [Gemmatales bacterium]MDW8387097.1 amidohydrolase [Gemmatales bacterium]
MSDFARLEQELDIALAAIPLIDPHSHINPLAPTARSLDDLLGYHYYTELAHSVGLAKDVLSPEVPPKETVRQVLRHLERFDNTVQYTWFLHIAREFLGFDGSRVGERDCDALWDAAEKVFSRPDWEAEVLRRSNVEKIFLTNDFDDPLTGFDTQRYVPCLRTDDLVFHLDKPTVRSRLAEATGIEVGDAYGLRRAIGKLFEHFVRHDARACAISLPPRFSPMPVSSDALSSALRDPDQSAVRAMGVFWMLAEFCRDFRLPFDLMIGVNRGVYQHGVYQGQDLFDQRTSLILYADLFNAFPDVTFCVSILNSGQSQELVAYTWIFPNVVTSGHWWYANIPAFIETDLRARLQAVPKTKQLGYYSDAYKLEFILPKYAMYRRVLARCLARDFVVERGWSVAEAVELARLLLRDNARRIFRLDGTTGSVLVNG